MEEKKFTDEKAMFNYIANEVLGQVKPLYLRKQICVNVLDLIKRLQSENAEQKAEIERLKSACECFQEMIISMQGRANNGKGVMVIYEVEQKKDGE